MRLNLKRVDAVAVILLAAGVVALAAALYAAVWLRTPAASPPTPAAEPAANPTAAVTLPRDHVATILHLDAVADSAAAARSGDRVDVLGYFSRQVTGGDSMTRLLLSDVAVLSVGRDASRVALTLALPQEEALLLQEVQALGARPFVTLRSAQPGAAPAPAPPAITDRDLTARLVANLRTTQGD